MHKIISVALAALPLLAACETEPKATISPNFGNAVTHNMAVQVINPDPVPRDSAADLDGEKASDAYKRYREGKVIRPRGTPTQNVVPAGSAGPAR